MNGFAGCGSSKLLCAPRPRQGSPGFTLLELLVVLAILGLAMSLVVVYQTRGTGTLRLKGAAARLAAELRLTRSQAIVGNRPVSFELDLRNRLYRAGTGQQQPLPDGMTIEFRVTTTEKLGSQRGAIRFNPDGSSTGGSIALDDGARRVVIDVNWLTGRVGLVDARSSPTR